MKSYRPMESVLLVVSAMSFVPAAGGAPAAEPAQFASVVDALAVPASAAFTNNGWDDTRRIRGVRWAWPATQSGQHDMRMEGSMRFGSDPNPHLGPTTLRVEGSRTYISRVDILIENEGPGDASPKAVQSLLGPATLQAIATSCDDDAATNGVATYEFLKTGFKPLYVHMASSWGAHGSGSVEVVVANDLDELLEPACKPLQKASARDM